MVSLVRDSRSRSLAKTVAYRVVAIALLAGITYYFTGNAGEATGITVLFNVTGAIAYYGLERLWESVEWGRSGPESDSDRNDFEQLEPPYSEGRALRLAHTPENSSKVEATPLPAKKRS